MPALPEEADDTKQFKWTFENSPRPRECHQQVLSLLQGAPHQSKGHCVRSGAQKGKGSSKMSKLSFHRTKRQRERRFFSAETKTVKTIYFYNKF